MKKPKPKLFGVDLFAGAGGLSLGFENAGFKILYAAEIDQHAAETYRRNRGEDVLVDILNVADLETKAILRKMGIRKGDIDIVLGGPPCQGFSTANTRTRNMKNQQNRLVFTFVELVRGLMPKWFVMENVGGLAQFDNGQLQEHLLALFKDAGYEAMAVVLDAAKFGVPQVRKRIFFIGNRVGKKLDFLRQLDDSNFQAVSVGEAIDDLPILPNGNIVDWLPYAKNYSWELTEYQRQMRYISFCKVGNNLVSANSSLVRERYKYIKQGENWTALVRRKPELLSNYADLSNCHQWIYLRLRCDRPSVVISNYRKNMLIHPKQDRGLSVREAARIQSFPDRYIFYGPIGYQQQQVANAVPPLLAQSIAVLIADVEGIS